MGSEMCIRDSQWLVADQGRLSGGREQGGTNRHRTVPYHPSPYISAGMPVAVMVSLYTGLTVIEVPSSIISTRVPFRPARRPSSNCPAPLLLRSRTIANHRTSRCLWTSCRPPLRWHKCHRNRWSLRRRSRRDRFRPMRRDSFSSCRLRDRQRGLPPPQVFDRMLGACGQRRGRERAEN